MTLVSHRGVVFYVKRVVAYDVSEGDVVMTVWRLVRERLKWEAVARLDLAGLARLTGLDSMKQKVANCYFWHSTRAVREWVYFYVEVNKTIRCNELFHQSTVIAHQLLLARVEVKP